MPDQQTVLTPVQQAIGLLASGKVGETLDLGRDVCKTSTVRTAAFPLVQQALADQKYDRAFYIIKNFEMTAAELHDSALIDQSCIALALSRALSERVKEDVVSRFVACGLATPAEVDTAIEETLKLLDEDSKLTLRDVEILKTLHTKSWDAYATTGEVHTALQQWAPSGYIRHAVDYLRGAAATGHTRQANDGLTAEIDRFHELFGSTTKLAVCLEAYSDRLIQQLETSAPKGENELYELIALCAYLGQDAPKLERPQQECLFTIVFDNLAENKLFRVIARQIFSIGVNTDRTTRYTV